MSTQTLVISPRPVVEVREVDTQVVEVLAGRPGERGEPGPPGPGASIERPAAATVNGHRLVAELGDGRVRHAGNDDLDDAGRVLGLSLNAALADEPVQIRMAGRITHSGWSFTAAAPVWLGAAGQLVQTPPVAGARFLLRVGVAVAPDTLVLRIAANEIEIEENSDGG